MPAQGEAVMVAGMATLSWICLLFDLILFFIVKDGYEK